MGLKGHKQVIYSLITSQITNPASPSSENIDLTSSLVRDQTVELLPAGPRPKPSTVNI